MQWLSFLALHLFYINIFIQAYPEAAFRRNDSKPLLESVCYHMQPLHESQLPLAENSSLKDMVKIQAIGYDFTLVKVEPIKYNRVQMATGFMLALRDDRFRLNSYKPTWEILAGQGQILDCQADGHIFPIISHKKPLNDKGVKTKKLWVFLCKIIANIVCRLL